MIIHFVCSGNTYRSRMAEAYLNSMGIPDWKAISSGIEATKNLNGNITSYAEKTLIDNHINQFTSSTWTQTTKESLEKSDLVIFMSPDVCDSCIEKMHPKLKAFESWEIRDVNSYDKDLNETSKNTFLAIKKKVNQMVEKRDF